MQLAAAVRAVPVAGLDDQRPNGKGFSGGKFGRKRARHDSANGHFKAQLLQAEGWRGATSLEAAYRCVCVCVCRGGSGDMHVVFMYVCGYVWLAIW
jgi:hypothetical protein